MRYLRLALFVLLLLSAVIFALSNGQVVDLRFWPFSEILSLRLCLIVLAALAIGLILGRMSLWPKHQKVKVAYRRAEKQLAALESATLPTSGKPPVTGRSVAA